MLVYNPRNHKEFFQYIPQLKTSGNVRHTFLNEVDGQGKSSYEGTALPVSMFSNISPSVVRSFKNAVHTCGGMSVLLYLHAMVTFPILSFVFFSFDKVLIPVYSVSHYIFGIR